MTVWYISGHVCFQMQGEPTTVTPNEDGTVDIPVSDDGTKIIVTFEPSDPSKPVSVSPIEVTACAEPGTDPSNATYVTCIQT